MDFTMKSIIISFLVSIALQIVNAELARRVVGGDITASGEFPWSASLHFHGDATFTQRYKHGCGGALVAQQWVLTAQHCFDDDFLAGLGTTSDWRVVLGEHELLADAGHEQVFTIDTVIRHPDYSLNTATNDMMLLKLDRPAQLNARVQVIGLDDGSCGAVGKTCTVHGWGAESEAAAGNGGTKHQKKVDLEIIDNAVCANNYEGTGHAPNPGLLCAKSTTGSGFCSGDSGGPFICQCSGNKWELTGIVGGTLTCGNDDYPGMFNRVSHFRRWIQANID